MSDTKHTPEPWYESGTGNYQRLIISEATGAVVALAYDKRDAPLLAAAPKLLAACKAIAEFFPASGGGKDMRAACLQVRDAIAGAEGGTP